MDSTPVPFVDLESQHAEVETDLTAAFHRVTSRGSFTLGEEVERFEREFADFAGTKEAIGVGSGTDALHFSLRACGVGPGDEVITAVNTFAATAEAILMCGARPVFVDIDPDSYLMDLDAVNSAITSKTKAIVPVHLYGQVVDVDALRPVAERRGIAIVEDACQAHGAKVNGSTAGSLGNAGCFSFYPSKNLGAMGDGGMVTTDDPHVAARVRSLRAHGEDANRVHCESGYCSRLHGMQAAFLRAKLPRLTQWNQGRRRVAEEYRDVLADTPLVLPAALGSREHVYHLYVVRVADREAFRSTLASAGVQTAIHYPMPLHLEPAFADVGFGPGAFPKAERISGEIVSLPMFPHMTSEQVQRVAEAVKTAVYSFAV